MQRSYRPVLVVGSVLLALGATIACDVSSEADDARLVVKIGDEVVREVDVSDSPSTQQAVYEHAEDFSAESCGPDQQTIEVTLELEGQHEISSYDCAPVPDDGGALGFAAETRDPVPWINYCEACDNPPDPDPISVCFNCCMCDGNSLRTCAIWCDSV